MGAFFESIALPNHHADEVRLTVTRWLSAKGFTRRLEPALFPCDAEIERAAYLFSSPRWTILLYSHMTEEGDRLRLELEKVGEPMVDLWVHDSDIWGYRLHANGDLLISFNSNPRYFGPDESELHDNGDPELFCHLLHLGDRAADIERLQRRRALFKEQPCRAFCRLIEAAPAGFGYRMIEEILDGAPPAQLGGFSVECLRFTREGIEPEAPRDLHSIPLREPPQPEYSDFAGAWQPPSWLYWYTWILSALMRPLFLLLAWVFRFYLWLYRHPWLRALLDRMHPIDLDDFTRELLTYRRPAYRIEGQDLINERYRCRLTLPAGAEPLPSRGRWPDFGFKIHDYPVIGTALYPELIANQLMALPGSTILHDEKFFAGPFAARTLSQMRQMGARVVHELMCFVQTPRAAYRFSLRAPEELPEDTQLLFKETIRTLRFD